MNLHHQKILQKWVGIQYTLDDNKVIPVLYEVIQKELKIGLGSFPQQNFQHNFTIPYTIFIQQTSLIDMKSWPIHKKGQE